MMRSENLPVGTNEFLQYFAQATAKISNEDITALDRIWPDMPEKTKTLITSLAMELSTACADSMLDPDETLQSDETVAGTVESLAKTVKNITAKRNALADIIDRCCGQKQTLLLQTHRGRGKTGQITNIAENRGASAFILPCSLLTAKDLTGVPSVENSQLIRRPNPIIDAAITYAENNPGKSPILVMDKLDRAAPEIIEKCVDIAVRKEIDGKKVPDNLQIVITADENSYKYKLDRAALARFVTCRVE